MKWAARRAHLQTTFRLAAVVAAAVTLGGDVGQAAPRTTGGLAMNTWYFVAWDSGQLIANDARFPACCLVHAPRADEMLMGDTDGFPVSPSTYGKAPGEFRVVVTDTRGAWLTVVDTLVPGDVFAVAVDGAAQGYTSAVPGFAFEAWAYGEKTWNPLAAWARPELSRGRFWIPYGDHTFTIRTVAPGWPAGSGGYGWFVLQNVTPTKGQVLP